MYIDPFCSTDGKNGTNCKGDYGENDDANKLKSFMKSR